MSNLSKVESDLNKLMDSGIKLQLGMLKDLDLLDKLSDKDEVIKKYSPLDFSRNYEQWYSEAFVVVKQLIPDRLNDFKAIYKIEKRSNVDYVNYTISDYLINVVRKIGDQVIVKPEAAYKKFLQQLDILSSAKRRLSSSLFDIKQILQADLFDSELECAKELLKKGYTRASAAIAGVLIEKHLKTVLENHDILISKKKPTISDLNDLLKANSVYEVIEWRFIQRLADLRNLSDHFDKDREPSKEEIEELLNGTDKIMKTIY